MGLTPAGSEYVAVLRRENASSSGNGSVCLAWPALAFTFLPFWAAADRSTFHPLVPIKQTVAMRMIFRKCMGENLGNAESFCRSFGERFARQHSPMHLLSEISLASACLRKAIHQSTGSFSVLIASLGFMTNC
jgi:hypothetical protein